MSDMKLLHPHSESRIIDNAVLTVSASGLSNKFIALEAEKGMCNEATYISSVSEYTFNFGEPDYSKYGQSGLNAIQWLRAGGGLWVIRVVPDDETFAVIRMGLGYKEGVSYTNDETKYKTLELTEAGIQAHNAAVSSADAKFSKGKASGNTAIEPLFYIEEGGNVVAKLGLMTEDEIKVYQANGGSGTGVAKKQVFIEDGVIAVTTEVNEDDNSVTITESKLTSPSEFSAYIGTIGSEDEDLAAFLAGDRLDYTSDFYARTNMIGRLNAVANENISFKLPLATADWQDTYEVYAKDAKDLFYSVRAADLNGDLALTETEIDELNFINRSTGRKLYAGKNVTEESSSIITEPSTGAYKKSKLYFVNNAFTGNAVESTSSTQVEIENFNFNNASQDPVELEAIDNGTLTYRPVLKTSYKVTYDKYTEGGDGSYVISNSDISLASLASACNNFFNEFADTAIMTAAVSTDTDGGYKATVTIDTTATVRITAEKYLSLGESLRAFFEIDSSSVDDVTYKFKSEILAAQFANSEIKKFFKADTENTDTEHYGPADELVTISNLVVNEVASLLVSDDGVPVINKANFGVALEITGLANVNKSISISLKFDSCDLVNTLLKDYSKATTADDVEAAFSSTGTGEYLRFPEFNIAAGGYEPNQNFREKDYNAIGFVTTSYSDFKLPASSYEESEVAEDRLAAKNGYQISADRKTIDTADLASLKVASNCFAEFCRFIPKGSGKWYNRLSVSLAYDNSMEKTYPNWSMFKLTISEKVDGAETSRESFNVSFDPDAISSAKESLYIEDVVNRYSSYFTCVMNYDNLVNFIDTKLAIKTASGKPVVDEDGEEIVIPIDSVIKYIFNQLTLNELKVKTFGEDYAQKDYGKYAANLDTLMSAIGYDENLCHLDTDIHTDDEARTQVYQEPFNSLYLFKTVSSSESMYANGGSSGHGWGYEFENDEGEIETTSTLEQALVKAYNGTTDALITNTMLCVFDLILDCNYPVVVKTAMSELASTIRQDCVTILDQGISTASAQQAIDKRKNEMNYDTFYTSIFTQHLTITDEWSGKPVKVTPTFFLASKIPLNDSTYSPAVNFVGPRRGTISGFSSISWMPTEPEKDSLYRAQVNYIERDTEATLFATELTSQSKNTPLSLIHPVRTLLHLRRDMLAISRNYRSEFATDSVYSLLQQELNDLATNYVLRGGYSYINPVINTSDYDRQQRICRVDVDVAFTDIIERFAFNFIVNRT